MSMQVDTFYSSLDSCSKLLLSLIHELIVRGKVKHFASICLYNSLVLIYEMEIYVRQAINKKELYSFSATT